MDPITHTLAGVALARAGLDRTTPLAAATLIIAANAPDVDVVTLFAGPYASLEFRRGVTHGPLALLLLPFIITAGVMAWDRWRRRRNRERAPARSQAVLLLAAIGVVSHPLFDWLNTYGVRLLSPFSDHWFQGDALFIIDPWLWLLLGAGLALARRWRNDRARSARVVRIAGAGALAYVAALIASSAIGERLARRAADAQGIVGIARVLYAPSPANPLAASIVVATSEGFRFGRLSWLDGGRVHFDDLVIARGDWTAPAVRLARSSDVARRYLTWAQFPYVRLEPEGSGTAVFFGDARYVTGLSGGGLQGVRVTAENIPR